MLVLGAFWCFVVQTKQLQQRKRTKSTKSINGEDWRGAHKTLGQCAETKLHEKTMLVFWSFVEQTNPQQIARQNTGLVVFGALWYYRRNHCNYKKAPKSTNGTKSTRAGREDWGGIHTTLWHCAETKWHEKAVAFWCFLVLCGTDEPKAKYKTKHIVGAFWCFVLQKKQL